MGRVNFSVFLLFILTREMSPGVGTSPDAMEMEKMRDSYSSIDLSSDSRSSAAMKELDDNLRPSLDREGESFVRA